MFMKELISFLHQIAGFALIIMPIMILSGRKKKSDGKGPSYYVVRRHRLGHALLGLVSRSLSEGMITYTKAGQVLGVKPRNVAPLLRDLAYQGDT